MLLLITRISQKYGHLHLIRFVDILVSKISTGEAMTLAVILLYYITITLLSLRLDNDV